MTASPQPPMTRGLLDRDAATRVSAAELDAAWADPAARIVQVSHGLIATEVTAGGEVVLARLAAEGTRLASHCYLGRLHGAPIFAEELTNDDSSGEAAERPGWSHPFTVAPVLSDDEATVLVVALALTAWHRTMGDAPEDGSVTQPSSGGWARTDAHGREHFPRMDPVVIVLIEHDDRILLGSNVLWERGRFSLLAGFIEAGESAEQAVAREVQEESGARVTNIRYVGSQPWPFPRSFMLGFRATLAPGVDPDSLVPDPTELSELRWFSRDEVRTPPPGIRLPMPMSIARWLIDTWLAEDACE